jgi:hypothetical protein
MFVSIEKQTVFSTKLIEEITEKFNKGYVVQRHEKFWYSNLVKVKRDGVTFSMTDDEMQEYIKCYIGVVNVRYIDVEINGQLIKEIEADIPDIENGEVPEMKGIHYFAEKYCKIKREDGSTGPMKLRDYQKDIIDLYMDSRFSILCGSRQIGKCTSADTHINVYNEKTGEYYIMPVFKFYYDILKKKSIFDHVKYGLYQCIYRIKYHKFA